MERPKIDKPTMDAWRVDDEQIATFLDDVRINKLNVQSEKYWQFHVPATNKYITYDQLLEKVNYRIMNIQPQYIESMKETIMALPDRLKIIREEIFSNFQKLISNRESMQNYIEHIGQYVDMVEGERDTSKDMIESLQKQIQLLETRQELAIEKARNIALRESILLMGGKTPEIPQTPEKQEVTEEPAPAATPKPKQKKSEFA